MGLVGAVEREDFRKDKAPQSSIKTGSCEDCVVKRPVNSGVVDAVLPSPLFIKSGLDAAADTMIQYMP